MAKYAKKCEESECECPEWIFTFADLVMLMMGFFVILWVLKPAPGQDATKPDPKWLEIQAALWDYFKFKPETPQEIETDKLLRKIMEIKRQKGAGAGGQTDQEPLGARGSEHEVTTVRPGSQSIVGTRIIFDPASAEVPQGEGRVIDEIAQQIRGWLMIVVIKGHTALDDYSDGATPQQQLELSLRRAQAVADALVARGVDRAVMRVQGCSTFEPIVQRVYGPDARAVNRRVEIEVTNKLITDYQSNGKEAPARADPPGAAAPSGHNNASH